MTRWTRLSAFTPAVVRRPLSYLTSLASRHVGRSSARVPRLVSYAVGLWVSLALLSSAAHGATYYLSPTGNNAAAGTSAAAPWKTFAFAIPKLQPGDTLTLLNGTYNNSNSGFPSIDCTRGASNGTASWPITVQALTERQAFVQGNGAVTAFVIQNCSYWNITGLRLQSEDNPNANGSALDIESSSHIELRRLLLAYSNRYQNLHLLFIRNSSNILVEPTLSRCSTRKKRLSSPERLGAS